MSIRSHGKRKRLGQHFLVDRKILSRILRVIAPESSDLIIEIGAGKGVLTFPLANKAGRVLAVEKDASLLPLLNNNNRTNLTILHADALHLNFQDYSSHSEAKIVGNLPYSISSPLLFKVIKERETIRDCVFLIQKEVAQRLCANPGTKSYAPISILAENAFIRKIHFKVSPRAFSPPPKVDSAVVSLKKREELLFPIADEDHFLHFLQHCFRHRRKYLLNNLKSAGFSPDGLHASLKQCDCSSHFRAEQVSLQQFVCLYRLLYP